MGTGPPTRECQGNRPIRIPPSDLHRRTGRRPPLFAIRLVGPVRHCVPLDPRLANIGDKNVEDGDADEGEIDPGVDARLVREGALPVGIGGLGRERGVLRGWDEGEELKSWPLDTGRRGEGLDSDFANVVGVCMFAVVMVVTAAISKVQSDAHLKTTSGLSCSSKNRLVSLPKRF
jgi:hypothetical protein